MQNHTLLANIIFKNKKYAIFTNQFHQKSFLEILKDDSYQYPSFEVFLELNAIYNKKDINKLYIIDNNKKYNFEPKVIFTNYHGKKVLIKVTALLLILGLLTSCKNNDTENITPIITEDSYAYGISIEENNDLKTKLNILKLNGLECGVINNIIYLKEDQNAKERYVYSNEEFKEYLSVKNPTFEDLREVLDKNQNMPSLFKKWSYDYIENVEKIDSNRDITVFYYNLSKLSLIFDSVKTIEDDTHSNTAAYFSPRECAIHFPENYQDNQRSKNYFEHELTHLWDSACIELDDTTIVRINNLIEVNLDDNYNLTYNYLGTALKEGLTDLVALNYGNNYKIDISGYYEIDDVVQIVCSYINEKPKNLISDGVINTIEKLNQSGIKDPLYFLQVMDVYYDSLANNNIFLTNDMRENIYEVIIENLTTKLISNGSSVKDIYNSVLYLLNDSLIQQNINKNYFITMIMYDQAQNNLKDNCIKYVSQILLENGINTDINSFKEAEDFCCTNNDVSLGEEIEEKEDSNNYYNNNNEDDFINEIFPESSLYIYETFNHKIKICYAIKDIDGNTKYFSYPNYIIIDDSDILYGEFLSVLQDLGIISANFDNNTANVEIYSEKWKTYFNDNYSNDLLTGGHDTINVYDSLYVYVYEKNDEKNYGVAYTAQINGELILYDVTTNEIIDIPIIGGEYFRILEEIGIIYSENDELLIKINELIDYVTNKRISYR